MIPSEQLAAWRELCDKATQGPWMLERDCLEGRRKVRESFNQLFPEEGSTGKVVSQQPGQYTHKGTTIATIDVMTIWQHAEKVVQVNEVTDDTIDLEMWRAGISHSADDAAFIAAARSAVPALLDEVERLRKDIDILLTSLCTTQNCCPDDVSGCSSNLSSECRNCWLDHIDRQKDAAKWVTP